MSFAYFTGGATRLRAGDHAMPRLPHVNRAGSDGRFTGLFSKTMATLGAAFLNKRELEPAVATPTSPPLNHTRQLFETNHPIPVEDEQWWKEQSLLRTPSAEHAPLEVTTLNALLGDSWMDHIDDPMVRRYLPELTDTPSFSAAQRDRLARKELCHAPDKPAETERLAHEYHQRMISLEVGETFSYCGAILPRRNRLREATERRLLETFDLPLAESFLSGNDEPLKRELIALIKPALSEIDTISDAIRDHLASAFATRIAPLLQRGADFLPDVIRTAIRKSVEADLRELGIRMPSNESMQLQERLLAAFLSHGIQGPIEQLLMDALPRVREAYTEATDTTRDLLHGALPSAIQEGLNFFDLSEAREPLALTIERAEDGRFTLSLYCKTERHIFPLVYREVREEQLRPEFFYQLVAYELHPDPDVSYDLDSLFSGLLDPLGIKPEGAGRISSSELRTLTATTINHHLIQRECSLPADAIEHALFEARLNALISFIRNAEAPHPTLLKAFERLGRQALTYHEGGHLSLERLTSIAATLLDYRSRCRRLRLEVNAGTHLPPTLLPPEVRSLLQSLLVSGGLSQGHITATRELLTQLFSADVAHEVEALFDELVGDLNNANPFERREAEERERTSLFSLDQLRNETKFLRELRPSLLHAYRLYSRYSRVVAEIAVASAGRKVLRGLLRRALPNYKASESLLLLIGWVLMRKGPEVASLLVPKVLRKTVKALLEQYHSILQTIKQWVFTLVAKATLQQLITADLRDAVESNIRQTRSTLTRGGTLSFERERENLPTETIPIPLKDAEPPRGSISPPWQPIDLDALAQTFDHSSLQRNSDLITISTLDQLLGCSVIKLASEIDLHQNIFSLVQINRIIRTIRVPHVWHSSLPENDCAHFTKSERERISQTLKSLSQLLFEHLRKSSKKYPGIKEECTVSLATLHVLSDYLCRNWYREEFRGHDPGDEPAFSRLTKLAFHTAAARKYTRAGCEMFEEFEPNGIEFMIWVQSHGYHLFAPSTIRQVEQIYRYYGYSCQLYYHPEELNRDHWRKLFAILPDQVGSSWAGNFANCDEATFAASLFGLFLSRFSLADASEEELAARYFRGEQLPEEVQALHDIQEKLNHSCHVQAFSCIPNEEYTPWVVESTLSGTPDIGSRLSDLFMRNTLTPPFAHRFHYSRGIRYGFSFPFSYRRKKPIRTETIDRLGLNTLSTTTSTAILKAEALPQTELLGTLREEQHRLTSRQQAELQMVVHDPSHQIVRAFGFLRRHPQVWRSSEGIALLRLLAFPLHAFYASSLSYHTLGMVASEFFDKKIAACADQMEKKLELYRLAIEFGSRLLSVNPMAAIEYPNYRELLYAELANATEEERNAGMQALAATYLHHTTEELVSTNGAKSIAVLSQLIKLPISIALYRPLYMQAKSLASASAPTVTQKMAAPSKRSPWLHALESNGESSELEPGQVLDIVGVPQGVEAIVVTTNHSMAAVKYVEKETGRHLTTRFAVQEGGRWLLSSYANEHLRNGRIVAPTTTPNGLALLSWFHADRIDCYVDPDQPTVLAAFDLVVDSSVISFDVKKGLAWNNDQFPGFFLAPQQSQQHSAEHPASLLLVNRAGDERLLIHGQPLPLLIGRILLKTMTGCASSLLIEKTLTSLTDPSGQVHSYSIDGKGQLVSTDPEAILYLLLHYTATGNQAQRKRVCGEFEAYCRTQPLTREIDELLQQISFSYLANRTEEGDTLVLWLITMRVENAYLYDRPIYRVSGDELINDTEILPYPLLELCALHIVFTAYLERVADGHPAQLTEEQELILFRYLIGTNRHLIERQILTFSPFTYRVLHRVGLDRYTAELGVSDRLRLRFQELATRHEGRGLWSRVFEATFSAQLASTPTLIPTADSLIRTYFPQRTLIGSFGKGQIKGALVAGRTLRDRFVHTPIVEEPQIEQVELFIQEAPSSLRALTSSNITRYFLSYYAYARGDLDGDSASLFRQNIGLLRGQFSPFVGGMIEILQALVSGTIDPNQLPPPATLRDALELREQLKSNSTEIRELPVDEELFETIGQFYDSLLQYHLGHQSNLPNAEQLANTVGDDRVALFFTDLANRLKGVRSFEQHLANMRYQIQFETLKGRLFSRETAIVVAQEAARRVPSLVANCALQALIGPSSKQIKMIISTANSAWSLFHRVSVIHDRLAPAYVATDLQVNTILALSRTPYIEKEEGINNLFKGVCRRHLITIKQKRPSPVQVPPVGTSCGATEEFPDLNTSLTAYQEKANSTTTLYRLQNRDGLGAFVEEIRGIIAEVEEGINREKSAIVAYANRTIDNDQTELSVLETFATTEATVRALTFDEIFAAFRRFDERSLLSYETMSQEKLSAIVERLTTLLVIASRFNLLHQKLEKHRGTWKEGDVQELAEELVRGRIYRFDEGSDILLRSRLLFESIQGCMLWSVQNDALVRIVESSDNGRIDEAPVGSGKTWFIERAAGTAIQRGSLGAERKLAIHVWPEELVEVNVADAASEGNKVYDQKINRLIWQRGKKPLDTYWALANLFRRSLTHGGQIHTTKQDLMSLELSLILLLSGEDIADPDVDQKILYLCEVLAIIQSSGVALIDEAPHVVGRPEKQLIFPNSVRKTLKGRTRELALLSCILQDLLSFESVSDLIGVETPNPRALAREVYEERIKLALVKKLARRGVLKVNPENRESFVRYLMGEIDAPLFVVNAAPMQRQLYGLTKRVVETTLVAVLASRMNSEYAFSRSREPFARPSDGNCNVAARDIFMDPIEAYLKSCVIHLNRKLNKHQLKIVLKQLRKKAEQRALNTNCDLSDTKLGRLYARASAGVPLSSETALSFELQERLCTNNEMILLFCEWVVAGKIEYFPKVVSANSTNFLSMFDSWKGVSGTVYQMGTLPTGTVLGATPWTDGERVAVLKTKCAASNRIVVIDDDAPKELLATMLTRYFVPGSSVRAIVDNGTLFSGIRPRKVVRAMLNHFRSHHPELKGVVFSDNGKKVVWEVGSMKPIPFSASTLSEHERATYYDEPRRQGFDVRQAPGTTFLLTLGLNDQWHNVAQATGRARGIWTRDESLILIMTRSTAGDISDNAKPSVDEIICYTRRNERNASKPSNFQHDQQEIRDVIRRAVLTKIIAEPSVWKKRRLLNRYRQLFETSVTDDEFARGGTRLLKRDPAEMVDEMKTRASYEIRSMALYFSYEEEQALIQRLAELGRGDYPETVPVYKGGEAVTFGQSGTVQVAADNDNDNKTHNNNDQQNQLSSVVSPPPVTYLPAPDQWEWDFSIIEENPPSTWFLTVPPTRAGKFQAMRERTGAAPILSVRASLRAADGVAPSLSRISKHFAGNLYATANFLQVFTHGIGTLPIAPFGQQQKPVYCVLAIRDPHGLRFLLVDQEEGEQWHRFLRMLGIDYDLAEFALYDVQNRCVTAQTSGVFAEEFQASTLWTAVLAQILLLDGDVSAANRDWLYSWIKRVGPDAVASALDNIHELRGSTYEGSNLQDLIEGIASEEV